MARIWDWQRPCTVRDLLEDLEPHRRLAYTTVMTVVDNLYKKGFLSRDRRGRTYYYECRKGREEYTADLISSALENSVDRSAGLLHFVQRMAPEEQAILSTSLSRILASTEASPNDDARP